MMQDLWLKKQLTIPHYRFKSPSRYLEIVNLLLRYGGMLWCLLKY
jgi:hypothetical protein